MGWKEMKTSSQHLFDMKMYQKNWWWVIKKKNFKIYSYIWQKYYRRARPVTMVSFYFTPPKIFDP